MNAIFCVLKQTGQFVFIPPPPPTKNVNEAGYTDPTRRKPSINNQTNVWHGCARSATVSNTNMSKVSSKQATPFLHISMFYRFVSSPTVARKRKNIDYGKETQHWEQPSPLQTLMPVMEKVSNEQNEWKKCSGPSAKAPPKKNPQTGSASSTATLWSAGLPLCFKFSFDV